MYEVPLLGPLWTDYYCPNCGLEERIKGSLPPGSSRYHTCPRLHMLSAPLIPANIYAKVAAEERADYLRGEDQATGDDGKPYMAVRTTRDEGDDLLVNAPTAHARLS